MFINISNKKYLQCRDFRTFFASRAKKTKLLIYVLFSIIHSYSKYNIKIIALVSQYVLNGTPIALHVQI